MNETPRYLDDRYNDYPDEAQLTRNSSKTIILTDRGNCSRNDNSLIKPKQEANIVNPNHLQKIDESFSRELKSNISISAPRQSETLTNMEQQKKDILEKRRKHPSEINAIQLNQNDDSDKEMTLKNNGSTLQLNRSIDNSRFLLDKLHEKTTSDTYGGFDFQNIIDEAKPGDIITLPDHVIRIGKILINKPLTIIGSSTSIIEVTHSIHINLSEFTGHTQKSVIFSECTIHFEYGVRKFSLNQSVSTKRSKESEEFRLVDKMSYSEHTGNQTKLFGGHLTTDIQKNNDRIYPLFVIYQNSLCELRDCNISSKNNKVPSQVFNDVCFYLYNDKTTKLGESNIGIYIQSTYIYDFYIAVQNEIFGKIHLEKLFISQSKGHAINISNPYILEMKECVIDSIQKSGINIRFSKEIDKKFSRKVFLSKNEISNGNSYGISIFGENMSHHSCDINISENKIYQCQKDGIGMKNLNISKINVEKNQICKNNGCGIFLQNVFDTVSLCQVTLNENKILQSKMYGITLIDVSCFSEKNEIFQNLKGGVLINGSENFENSQEYIFFKQYPLRTIFNSTHINNNQDSGILIVGGQKGPIIFNSCEIYENMNGVYIKQSPLILAHDTHLSIEQPSMINLGDIVFEKCILFQNKLSGIHIKTVCNKIYLKETSISENKNHALFLQNEEQQGSLVFRDLEKGKIRNYISGYVGGSWGELYPEHFNSCKAKKCNIF